MSANKPLRVQLPRPRRPVLPAVLAVLASGIVLIIALVGIFSGFDKTSGGEVGVVRNGGWFDNNRIRQVIQPGANLTWTGFWSTTHKYPAQQRFYTITADAPGFVSNEGTLDCEIGTGDLTTTTCTWDTRLTLQKQSSLTIGALDGSTPIKGATYVLHDTVTGAVTS